MLISHILKDTLLGAGLLWHDVDFLVLARDPPSATRDPRYPYLALSTLTLT